MAAKKAVLSPRLLCRTGVGAVDVTLRLLRRAASRDNRPTATGPSGWRRSRPPARPPRPLSLSSLAGLRRHLRGRRGALRRAEHTTRTRAHTLHTRPPDLPAFVIVARKCMLTPSTSRPPTPPFRGDRQNRNCDERTAAASAIDCRLATGEERGGHLTTVAGVKLLPRASALLPAGAKFKWGAGTG